MTSDYIIDPITTLRLQQQLQPLAISSMLIFKPIILHRPITINRPVFLHSDSVILPRYQTPQLLKYYSKMVKDTETVIEYEIQIIRVVVW
jgi:hypothetical protein